MMLNSQSNKNALFLNTFAWLIIALFYFYQYILRVSPGIMVVELREIFKLTAQEFSSLGSIYLFSYSLLQIPLGFILDYFGARRVMMLALFSCIMGTCLFAFAKNLGMLQLGRFLIGLGSAPAFIGALKLVSDHLPKKFHGLFMGITLAVGTFGALLSGKFLVSILEHHGWQNTLLLCAGFGGFILLLAFATVPGAKQSPQLNTFSHFCSGITAICKKKEIIIYAIIAICVYTPLCVLADLWGTAFLMEKFSLPRAKAAQLALYLYGGLTLGSLVLPWLSLKIDKLKEVIQICIVGIIISLSILLFSKHLNLWQLALILTLIGVFCGAEMICFAGAAECSPSGHLGLTLGVVNTLNMLGGAVIQQIIGWYLDLQWKGQLTQEGIRFYSATELSLAFSFLVIIIFTCGLLSLKLSKRRIPVAIEVELA